MSGSAEGRNHALVVGVVAASALGMFVVWSAFGGSPAPQRSAQIVAGDSPVGNEGVEDESPVAAQPGSRLIENYEVFAPKDPFEPLVGGGGAALKAASPSVTGGVTATFDNGTRSAGYHHEIKVLDVQGRSVTVSIDSIEMTVREGEIFAERFQLLSVADQCATMLMGDDQFTLCKGEQIFK